MQRILCALAVFCALSCGVCAAAVVYPGGIAHDAGMRGIYPGPDPGGCCWLAPRASFSAVQPAGTDVMLLDIAIPPYALQGSSGVRVDVSIGSGAAESLCCFDAGVHEIALRVRPAARAHPLTATVRASNVFVPRERGIGGDTRKLTILLQAVAFQNTALGIRYVGGENVTSSPPARAYRWLSIAVAFAVGLATLLLTLRRARYAWLALLVTAPTDLAVYVGSTTVTIEKAALVGAAIGLLCTARRLRALQDRRLYWVGGTLLLTIVSMCVSDAFAAHLGAAARETLKAIQYLGTLCVALAAYADDADEPLLRTVLAVEVLVVALTALAQEFVGGSQGTFIAGIDFPRIAGLLEGPNQLAGFLGVTMAFVFGFGALTRSTLLERTALAIGSIALLLSFSRGGILGFAVSVAILLAMRAYPRVRETIASSAAIAWGAGALSLLVAAGVLLAHERAAIFAQSAVLYRGGLGTRSELWYAALTLWRAHPLLGVGPGNFELLVGSMFPGVKTHANGQLLQALSEQGLVGLLALGALVAAAFAAFARDTRVVGIAAFAMVLGFWTHELFDSLLIYPKVGIVYWALIGIALAPNAAARIARSVNML